MLHNILLSVWLNLFRISYRTSISLSKSLLSLTITLCQRYFCTYLTGLAHLTMTVSLLVEKNETHPSFVLQVDHWRKFWLEAFMLIVCSKVKLTKETYVHWCIREIFSVHLIPNHPFCVVHALLGGWQEVLLMNYNIW